MNGLSIEELEETASSYQQLMVPALFEGCAELLLNEARITSADKVLDIACGTGVVARFAADHKKPAFVAGLDMNPGMLTVAKKLAPGIDWRQGKAEELPWDDNFFNVVVSQFGLMFFENKQAALQEMLRVLEPGGRIVVAVFDSLGNNHGYNLMTETFSRTVGEEIAQALRLPFSLGDAEQLEMLCSESGLVPVQISTQKAEAVFPNVKSMVLADVKGWFPIAGIQLNDSQIRQVVSEAEIALDEFIREDNSVSFPLSVHLIAYTSTG